MSLRINDLPKFAMLFLFTATTLGAGDRAESSWENLRQLKAGQRLEVVQMDLESIRGKFLSASGESISLQTTQDQITVPRANVLWISRRGGKRGRNALIGAAMGGGAGAAMGAAGGGVLPSSKRAGSAVGLGAAGAIIGAGAGVFFRSHTTIYRGPETPAGNKGK